MEKNRGFSLTEVLISLLLMTITSLALIKQQWIITKFYNQLHLQMRGLIVLDNASESLLAGKSAFTDEFFHYQIKQDGLFKNLEVVWLAPASNHSIDNHLTRFLISQ